MPDVRFSDRRASTGDSSARASFTPDSNATRSIRETCEGREPAENSASVLRTSSRLISKACGPARRGN
ncbi:hypothetical protein DIPPA_34126 [Diplonema papillatum]|nr:hypothetical protein DIPPA_34126 [Diplonema papillatum]